MESFFRNIGMPTSIHELIGKELTEEEIKTLAYKCSFMHTRTIGQFKVCSWRIWKISIEWRNKFLNKKPVGVLKY